MNLTNERVRSTRRAPHALHPCQPCKLRKRRCGKELPECSLCTRYGVVSVIIFDPFVSFRLCQKTVHNPSLLTIQRTGRPCEYAASNTSGVSKRHQLRDIPHKRFPAAYFLDYAVFQHCNLAIDKPQMSLPPAFQDAMPSTDEVRLIADGFFTSVHVWFPIINRNKFYGNFTHASLQHETDLALLVLCMKMLIAQPSGDESNSKATYLSVKSLLVQLEQAGFFSITILQALLLTALYEIGAGIYPSAYMTVGTCARYASALSLDRDIFKWDQSASDWIGMEERHRAWWAAVVLDRYVGPRRG